MGAQVGWVRVHWSGGAGSGGEGVRGKGKGKERVCTHGAFLWVRSQIVGSEQEKNVIEFFGAGSPWSHGAFLWVGGHESL